MTMEELPEATGVMTDEPKEDPKVWKLMALNILVARASHHHYHLRQDLRHAISPIRQVIPIRRHHLRHHHLRYHHLCQLLMRGPEAERRGQLGTSRCL